MHDVLALGQVVERDAAGIEPLPPRLGRREFGLDLVVFDDAALRRVDEEHLAGAQAALAHDRGSGSMSSTPISLASTTRPSSVTR